MLIESLQTEGQRARIALVTVVPSFVSSLTDKDASRLGRRGIHCLRVKEEYAARVGATLHGAFVDLFFLPAITGEYALNSASNVRELAQRLAPYDLVVDLCEFSALYRRGKTTKDAIDDFHTVNGQDADTGLLEYQNFLNVITALNTTFNAILGRVVRPLSVIDQSYEWGLGRSGKLAITGMSHGDPVSLHEEDGNMILDAVLPNIREEVRAALDVLDGNGMKTLSDKVMFSGYLSDMAGIQEAVLENTDPSFTFTLQDVFEHRRAKYRCNRPADACTVSERQLLADILTSEQSLSAEPMQFSLVDYYRISGGPAEIRRSGVDEATKQRFVAFRAKFEAAMAFARHWDSLEDTYDTEAMNKIVNGWYMSNSCLGILRDARKAGLRTPHTAWGVPTLMTNSIGLIPNAQLHDESIRQAIYGALSEIVPEPVAA